VKICLAIIAILILSALGVSPERAFANPSSFSPEFETGIDTMGVFGNNYFLQTVVARGNVHVDGYAAEDNAATMLGGAEAKTNDYRRLMIDQHQFVSTLTWMLGYAYYRSGGKDSFGDQVDDESHAFKLGVAWDVARAFDVTLAAAYQIIPVENYSQGYGELRLGYTFSLADKQTHEEIVGDDAEAFYLRQAQRESEVVTPAKDTYPNLRVGGNFVFTHQDKSPTTSGRSAGAGLTNDVTLNQAGSGPDLTFALNSKLRFRFEMLIYYYDNNPQAFLSNNTTIGETRPRAGLAIADIEDTTPLLLTFPYRSFTEEITIDLTPTTRIDAALQQSTYFATTGYPLTNSVGGVISQKLSTKLRVGGALDLTNSTSYSELVGGFSLGYDL
jgi:hypothetical protein